MKQYVSVGDIVINDTTKAAFDDKNSKDNLSSDPNFVENT